MKLPAISKATLNPKMHSILFERYIESLFPGRSWQDWQAGKPTVCLFLLLIRIHRQVFILFASLWACRGPKRCKSLWKAKGRDSSITSQGRHQSREGNSGFAALSRCLVHGLFGFILTTLQLNKFKVFSTNLRNFYHGVQSSLIQTPLQLGTWLENKMPPRTSPQGRFSGRQVPTCWVSTTDNELSQKGTPSPCSAAPGEEGFPVFLFSGWKAFLCPKQKMSMPGSLCLWAEEVGSGSAPLVQAACWAAEMPPWVSVPQRSMTDTAQHVPHPALGSYRCLGLVVVMCWHVGVRHLAGLVFSPNGHLSL